VPRGRVGDARRATLNRREGRERWWEVVGGVVVSALSSRQSLLRRPQPRGRERKLPLRCEEAWQTGGAARGRVSGGVSPRVWRGNGAGHTEVAFGAEGRVLERAGRLAHGERLVAVRARRRRRDRVLHLRAAVCCVGWRLRGAGRAKGCAARAGLARTWARRCSGFQMTTRCVEGSWSTTSSTVSRWSLPWDGSRCGLIPVCAPIAGMPPGDEEGRWPGEVMMMGGGATIRSRDCRGEDGLGGVCTPTAWVSCSGIARGIVLLGACSGWLACPVLPGLLTTGTQLSLPCPCRDPGSGPQQGRCCSITNFRGGAPVRVSGEPSFTRRNSGVAGFWTKCFVHF